MEIVYLKPGYSVDRVFYVNGREATRAGVDRKELKRAYDRAYAKARESTSEYKTYRRAYRQTPGYKLYARDRELKFKYGITSEQVKQMIKSQDGVCAICKKTPNIWHIDHCHNTGAIRKMLCLNCNNGLGRFNDDPELLQAAIKYLETHNASN